MGWHRVDYSADYIRLDLETLVQLVLRINVTEALQARCEWSSARLKCKLFLPIITGLCKNQLNHAEAVFIIRLIYKTSLCCWCVSRALSAWHFMTHAKDGLCSCAALRRVCAYAQWMPLHSKSPWFAAAPGPPAVLRKAKFPISPWVPRSYSSAHWVLRIRALGAQPAWHRPCTGKQWQCLPAMAWALRSGPVKRSSGLILGRMV